MKQGNLFKKYIIAYKKC